MPRVASPLGWWANTTYSHNRKGNPKYPPWTSVRNTETPDSPVLTACHQHYDPDSKLFKQQDRKALLSYVNPCDPCLNSLRLGNAIIISDIAIGCMLAFLAAWSYRVGFHSVWSLYFVPWLVSSMQSSAWGCIASELTIQIFRTFLSSGHIIGSLCSHTSSIATRQCRTTVR